MNPVPAATRPSPTSGTAPRVRRLPVTAIVLTFNEQAHIRTCLESLRGWADEVVVVDSHSTDRTVEIARELADAVHQHEFVDYSAQRNWAQALSLRNEWVFHLDAGERVTPELERSLREIDFTAPKADGYLIARRAVFMGRWIRHGGHYPVYHLRLFRRSKGRCERRRYDQHFLVGGPTSLLAGDIADEISPDLTEWTARHNRWATEEAKAILSGTAGGEVPGRLFGTSIERRRWLKGAYYSLPPLLRPFLYFFVRYFLRLGFLDGREGLVFHFLQGFWFRFLVDAKVMESRLTTPSRGRG